MPVEKLPSFGRERCRPRPASTRFKLIKRADGRRSGDPLGFRFVCFERVKSRWLPANWIPRLPFTMTARKIRSGVSFLLVCSVVRWYTLIVSRPAWNEDLLWTFSAGCSVKWSVLKRVSEVDSFIRAQIFVYTVLDLESNFYSSMILFVCVSLCWIMDIRFRSYCSYCSILLNVVLRILFVLWWKVDLNCR